MSADLVDLRAPIRTPSDFSQLMKQVQQARLLDRSFLGYLPRVSLLLAMAVVGAAAAWWLGQSWWQLGVAAWFAVVSAQIGFLGHDAGHQQVFRGRRWNDAFGQFLSNAMIGLSYGWWVGKHTRHHQHPNDTASDPDVQRNVLAWSPAQVRDQPAALRLVAAHQAWVFFPLLLLEAGNLHLNSLRSLGRRPRGHGLEIAMLAAHFTVYFGLLFWWLSPLQAVTFVLVHQGLLGLYLGCSFAPNHKGMHMPRPGERLDFLRRQVLTSRNVTGGRVLSALLGSLNYQIEHHLFPSMPSRNLRHCQPLVRQFCGAQAISYCESSLLASYATSLRYLRDLSPARS